MKLLPFLGFLAAVATAAPDAPLVYRFSGKPLRIPVACTTEQVHALSLSCSESDPCRTFLELTDFDEVASRMFIAGNIHTDSTTLESVLLASEDGGKSWTEPAPRIPMAGLDIIQFLDFESGWISGQIQHGQPRDPFLLVSRDGGKSWRKREVLGEGQPGVVDKFAFDSRTHGLLLIDRVQADDNGMRHILYETSTGGDNWSIREISPKPLPWKQAPRGDRDLRLRTDAATKSYRLERRDSTNKWDLIAAFQVSSGDCKPPEYVEPESPPPVVEERPDPRRQPTLKK